MPKSMSELKKEIAAVKKRKREEEERKKLEMQLKLLTKKQSKFVKTITSPRVKSAAWKVKFALDRAARNLSK